MVIKKALKGDKKKMKKIMLLIVFLILSTVIIFGCSSEKPNIRNRQGPERNLNLTEEERQQMFQEMQQKAVESCSGKNEGDNCQFQGRTGAVNDADGICKISGDNLICTGNRTMGQRRE